jgi:hypothetical protein
MDIRNVEGNVDLKMNLLCGDEMTCDKLVVKPLTIRKIKEIGFMNYNRFLSVVTLDVKSLTNYNPDLEGMSIIDRVIKSRNDMLISSFSEAMGAFLNEDVNDLLINDTLGFVFGGKNLDRDAKTCNVVDSSNFSDFIKIIKYQNCLVEASEKYVNEAPASDKAKLILEKLKKGKEMVEKAKSLAKNSSSKSSDTDFADVISAVSTKSNNFNRSNIWDSTVYQLYDEYKRLEAISSYEINIAAMIQGAKIDDLRHWAAKVD